jgi:Mitochondrial domain of unknown function (DUF1713)
MREDSKGLVSYADGRRRRKTPWTATEALRFRGGGAEKSMDKSAVFVLHAKFTQKTKWVREGGGDSLGSVIKKRRKKMRKHKHKKLLAKTRHQRRSR